MNRHDATLIAEQLHKLDVADYRNDEFLTVAQLSERLQVSKSWIAHNKKLPRKKFGRAVRYPLNKVVNLLNKKEATYK